MIFQDKLNQSLQANGNNIAIEYKGKKISYRSLQSIGEKVFEFLMNHSLDQETIIGIDLAAKADIISSIIGVANARCVFVLIDRKLPASRVDHMIADMKFDHVITTSDRLEFYEHREVTNVWEYQKIQASESVITEIKIPKAAPDDSLYIYYTSGSTGVPKAILGKNSSLIHFLQWETKAFAIDSSFRFSQLISPYFDAFLRDAFVPLMVGATICIPPDEEDFLSEDKLISWIDDTKISLIHCVPSLFEVFNSEKLTAANFANLKYVLLSGEKIIPSDLSNWYNVFDDRIQLVNLYGTTEATMIRSCYRIQPQDVKLSKIPIGHPIADTELLIATKDMKPCSTMVQGELYIISDYLTKGYLNAPEQTKEKFITINAGTANEKNAYKTGDLAVRLINGNIELLGREDRQVKIRGIRVELDEIESLLKKSDLQKNAVVMVISDDNIKQSIVAFIVKKDRMQSDKTINVSLSEYLKEQLPEYMMPSEILVLDQIPLLSNGKTDYKALKRIQKSDHEMVLPTDQIEEQILGIWKGVLGEKPISITDIFHKIGGNSLTLMSLIARLNKAFEVRISLSQIFQNSTVQKQATFIREARKEAFENIPKADKADDYMLSSTQKRMFFLNEFNENSIVYNMPQVVRLEGKLNRERIEYVFKQLIVRHESLRTSFELLNGEPVQKISDNVDFNIEYFNSGESGIPDIISKFIRPFDLSSPSLFRVGIIEISSNEHILTVDLHHIISDGVSNKILIEEFMTLYKGDTLPELKLTYKDFALWQKNPGQQESLIRQQEFWKKEFSENVTVLDLPTDFPRPEVKSHRGGKVQFSINEEETKKLTILTKQSEATMFMTVLSIFNILLSRLTNQQDIVIGSPVAGRVHADLEGIMGMFVNTLTFRNFPKGNLSFRMFLSEVKKKALSCFENQSYQYEELIADLNIQRETGRNPLFDVMFVFHNIEQEDLAIEGLTLKPYESGHKVSKFDLTLGASESLGQLHLNFEYSTDLFKKETIDRFICYFKQIVTEITQDADMMIADLDILPEEEKYKLLHEFNDTKSDYPQQKTIIDLFEEQVELTPDKVALVFEGRQLTFRNLDKISNVIANELLTINDKSDHVAICLTPSIEMIVGIIGILKSGKAFMPLDPDHNPSRHEQILIESNCNMLLTSESLKEYLSSAGKKLIIEEIISQNKSTEGLTCNVKANDLAYIIYTSGSTGKPKGVKIDHGNLMNYVCWFRSAADLISDDKLLLNTSFAFDAIYTQLFSSLINGSELHVVSKAVYLSPEVLLDYIVNEQISILKMTPTLFSMIINDRSYTSESFMQTRLIILGGEAINGADVLKVISSGQNIRFMNHYGPTETTIGSIAQYIHPASLEDFLARPTIGKPINNTNCYVLGCNHELTPIGCEGELCIGGDGVGIGYMNNEQQTKEKFINNPFKEGDRIYKTGDLARWLPNGNLEYLGRLDHQVKIRGHRIEPGEIEQLLISHKLVGEALVVAIEKAGSKHLVAYYISTEEVSQKILSEYLAERLPDYMLPMFYVKLEKFPLTPNGKTDRKALPDPEFTSGDDYEAPTEASEEILVEIWAEVLGIKKDIISINRNFFELGGDSIKVLQLKYLIKEKMSLEVSVLELFRYTSISSFGAFVNTMEGSFEKLENELDVEVSGVEALINRIG